jgi:transposase
MEKIPQGRYTPEFRAEAVKLITEGGLSSSEASRRLSLPKSTLENWVRASKTGKLSDIGKSQRPLTDVEMELAQVKRELVITKMERDLLKKAAAYFAKESLQGTR